ncbi:MAG TPA: hypothetical protein VFP10_11650, partial [Candidatus Eisenbacteria bacterium]|nr:hypothetical protein [Candidatus Eisenbacteria bacterium]
AIGKTVFFSVRLLMGSTTTFGTGTYTFTLPPLPAISTTGYVRIGSAYLRDSSASSTGHFEGITLIDPSLSTTAFFVISEPSVISATVPFTWANGDSVNASGFYQTS